MPEIKFSAGTDPNDPELIKRLQTAEQDVMARHAANAGDLSELADLKDSFTILGQPARPLSAGVIVILQKIEHPLFAALDGAEIEEDEQEIPLEDMAVLLFVQLHPDIEELIDWAMTGELKKKAIAWAFTVDQSWLQAAMLDIQAQLDQYVSAMDVYGVTDGGDADPGKKQEAKPPTTS